MRYYVGVTDKSWFEFLAERAPDEVNFWRPGETSFKVVEPGAPFLFKLHSPNNFIAGGGFFVRYARLPLSLSWEGFGEKNGRADYRSFRESILAYRRKKGAEAEVDPQIGCIVLALPFFFRREDWIPIPADWASNIVAGRSYETTEQYGAALWRAVEERLPYYGGPEALPVSPMLDEGPRYSEQFLTRARLGQGAFRVLVTEAYDRKCAITGEKTLPVLQAAHIKPYGEGGPHVVNNGLLLRSDLHILFDKGYLTVTPDYHVEVSKRIKEEWSNGKEYYAMHGRPLARMPAREWERPSRELIEWHNEQVWVG